MLGKNTQVEGEFTTQLHKSNLVNKHTMISMGDVAVMLYL